MRQSVKHAKVVQASLGECYCMLLLGEDGTLKVLLATTSQISMVIQQEKLQPYFVLQTYKNWKLNKDRKK